MRSRYRLWCGTLALAALAGAQPALHLKRAADRPPGRTGNLSTLKRANFSRSHWILQFDGPPDRSHLDSLARRGVRVVGYVPDNGLSVSVPDDVRPEDFGPARPLRLAPEEKLSSAAAAADAGGPGRWVIEFHPDAGPAAMRQAAHWSGARIFEHPDLLPHQLMVAATLDQRLDLAAWDEVAYIFPASPDLIEGRPVAACAGGATEYGIVGQYAALAAKRAWSAGPSGAVRLFYHFGPLTSRAAPDQVQSELRRALAEWSSHAAIDFSESSSATSTRTVNFLFGSGSHGDNYPFDGAGKTLAHTFYPSPPNAEPLAGDVHFDGDESWQVGAGTDIYSVALHELGHALGLGHSDEPGTVMYPYYRRADTLTDGDVAALRVLYAARSTTTTTTATTTTTTTTADVTPPAAAPPAAADTVAPSLAIQSPSGTSVLVSAPSITLRGTARDNVGVESVRWSASSGASGVAQGTASWSVAGLPLLVGANTVTVRAYDAAGNSSWRSLVITRR